MEEIKYCEDCKHLGEHNGSTDWIPCNHPNAERTGIQLMFRWSRPNAYTERTSGNCGPEGKNWERKVKK